MAVPMAAVPVHERPRERLLVRGPEALTERELLAIILRSGTRGASAIDLSTRLLAEYGGLRLLASARPEELAARTGIGTTKAASLVAAFELGRRADVDQGRPVLRCADDVAEIALRELGGLRRERVLVFVCDAANRLRQTVTVSEGSIDKSLVPVREVLNAVLRHDGRAFAIAHNHPSGDPQPSPADLRATDELRSAAAVVGLRFLGHVIV
ncbi:MAG TPA: DNA repair protein RadC [Egibacteraceae bacterium]|nr:DNA repair protein RadC [Egibacteraceae bacterium]